MVSQRRLSSLSSPLIAASPILLYNLFKVLRCDLGNFISYSKYVIPANKFTVRIIKETSKEIISITIHSILNSPYTQSTSKNLHPWLVVSIIRSDDVNNTNMIGIAHPTVLFVIFMSSQLQKV